jgi:hypothetical protein
VDGIYLAWSMLVKTISTSKDKKEVVYAKAQEACRKGH